MLLTALVYIHIFFIFCFGATALYFFDLVETGISYFVNRREQMRLYTGFNMSY